MATYKTVGLARRFSTSAPARGTLVKAPIQLFGIDGRYAHALYSAASKKNSLEKVDQEVKKIQTLLKTDVKFAEFCANPTIQRKAKKDVITATLQKQNFDDITVNFFCALAENGRLGKADSFLSAFGKIMAAKRGEVLCTVTTAKPLDASQQKELEVSLNLFLKKGETLQLTMEVNPDLIGGMTVSIGDRFVDMSIASKLHNYDSVLKQAL